MKSTSTECNIGHVPRDRECLEAKLAEAYTANAAINLELATEFKHVDEEGF